MRSGRRGELLQRAHQGRQIHAAPVLGPREQAVERAHQPVVVIAAARRIGAAHLRAGRLLTVNSSDAKMGFANILVPHLAVEWEAADWLTLRAGGWIRPAVTLDQAGITNYLDNFSESVAGGATFRFSDPLEVFSEKVALDLGAQAIFANPRTDRKQAVDPTGSATYGGMLISFAAMVRYLY